MAAVTDCKAVFSKMGIQLNRTQMVFDLDPESVGALPLLSRLTGQRVFLSIEPSQGEIPEISVYTEED